MIKSCYNCKFNIKSGNVMFCEINNVCKFCDKWTSKNEIKLTCHDCKKNQDCVSYKSGNKKTCGLFTENIEYIKSCNTCKWVSGVCCNHPTGVCAHLLGENVFYQKWEPKQWENKSDNRCIHNYIPQKYEERPDVLKSEEKMDKIQMTKEQAIEILKDTGAFGFEQIFIPDALNNLKKSGYIKKDIVEEAEEMYSKKDKVKSDIEHYDYLIEWYERLVDKQHKAIQFLKKQLEDK